MDYKRPEDIDIIFKESCEFSDEERNTIIGNFQKLRFVFSL